MSLRGPKGAGAVDAVGRADPSPPEGTGDSEDGFLKSHCQQAAAKGLAALRAVFQGNPTA